jgi:hypothetical protein
MRVYVPSTLPLLRELLDSGRIGPPPITALAVTPAIREWYLDDDIQALEYAALTEAARASLRLLARSGALARRVVLACDVDDSLVSPSSHGGRGPVTLKAEVKLAQIEAAHVDTVDASADVVDAVAALSAAEAGDDDAQFIVDSVEDHELAWFARQEIPDLLT